MNKIQTEAPKERPRRKGRRSPNFPYIDLGLATQRLKAMYEAEGVHEAPMSSIAKHWGYSPTSSSLDKVLGALNAYGLVESQGVGHDRSVRISERGRDILERHDSPERTRAIQDAALAPSFFQSIRTKYGAKLPSEDTVRTWMVRELEFNPKSVESAIANYRETVRYAGLDGAEPADGEATEKGTSTEGKGQDTAIDVGHWVQWKSQGQLQFPEGPRQVVRIDEHDGEKYVFVVDRNGTEGAFPISQAVVANPTGTQADVAPFPPKLGTGTRSGTIRQGLVDDVYSLGAGRNIVVQTPEKLDEAEYGEICDFFELLKRKLQRRVNTEGK